MNKKNIGIIVGVVVLAIIIVLVVLFNTKNEVEFNTNGGSEVTSQKIKFMSSASRPSDPTREGYVFDNWYYNGEVFNFDTKVTKGMVIEARWIEAGTEGTYTVTFDSDGGSSVAKQNVKENGTITKPSDPTRDGYKFVEWQYNGKKFDFSTKVTKAMTLTAKWEKDDSEQPAGGEKTASLSSGNFSLTVGKTKKLSVKNATGKASWKSSNTKVATVDANGNVKAIAAGTATITCTVDGKTLTVKVTVKAASQGGNTGTTTPENPSNPETPVDPQPEEPKPLSEYSAVCEDVADSSVAQCTIRIKDKNGNNVNGTVTVTTKTGSSKNYATGSLIGKPIISSLKVASVN